MDYATLGVLRPSGLRRKTAAKLRKPSYRSKKRGMLVSYITLAPGWPSFCILTSIGGVGACKRALSITRAWQHSNFHRYWL